MIKILRKARDYKQFINQVLGNPLYGRGAKTRLAQHLKVQGSFISLVLSGPQDFSAEHSIKIADFLKLGPEETEYFMTMVQRDRASTPALRAYYQRLLDRIGEGDGEGQVKIRIRSKEIELGEQDLGYYYGTWYNAAVHMAIHHPKYRTVSALVEWTQLKEQQVRESIDVLVRLGFAQFDKDKVLPSERRFHLANRSPALRSHHINWRNQAIRSLDESQPDALHYSLVMNIDEETAKKIREVLLESIRKTDQHLERAKIESVYSLCLDLFKVF